MSKQAKQNVFTKFTNWLSTADFIRLDDGCMLDDWCLDLQADGDDAVLTVNWESGCSDYEERFTRKSIENGHFENGKFCLVNDEGESAWINAGKVVPHYPSEENAAPLSEFTVKWEIEVDADSPWEAAKQALSIMRDRGSDATYFNITDAKGELYDVDIEEERTRSVAKPPLNRVGVIVEGGIVQSIVATRPEELDVVVIDYDIEGSHVSELGDVEQSDGSFSEAIVSLRGKAEEATINLNRLFDGEE